MNQIILDKVSKSFRTNNYVVKAVTQAEFATNAGEAVAIIGPSGSGKSTLLNMLGLILSPDDGQIIIDGKDVTNMPDNVLCCFRNSNFGYIVQDFALLDQESVYSNIRIPLLYSKKIRRREHKARIHAAARELGIFDKLHRKAGQLSGGERQRVAIARAIVCDQPIILADEPTGALNRSSSLDTMEVFLSMKREGNTILMVTHDSRIASFADRILYFEDGSVKAEFSNARGSEEDVRAFLQANGW